MRTRCVRGLWHRDISSASRPRVGRVRHVAPECVCLWEDNPLSHSSWLRSLRCSRFRWNEGCSRSCVRRPGFQDGHDERNRRGISHSDSRHRRSHGQDAIGGFGRQYNPSPPAWPNNGGLSCRCAGCSVTSPHREPPRSSGLRCRPRRGRAISENRGRLHR